MSGFSLFYNKNNSFSEPAVTDSLKNIENFCIRTFKHNKTYSASYFLKNDTYSGKRTFDNDYWTILFAGETIDYNEIPFSEIINWLEKKDFSGFSKFKNMFALAAYDKINRKYYLISDSSSLYPVFYSVNNDSLFFSTELSAFTKLLKKPSFNEEWLYEFMCFNFPLGSKTFIKDVHRIQAASVLIYDDVKSELRLIKYEEFLGKTDKLLKGKESLELAKEIFSNRIPLYYKGTEKAACALTSGWDGRTILALAPDYNRVTAYTYGLTGCNDLYMGSSSARETGIKHLEIHLDEKFLDNLTKLVFETVYLSSGLQTVLRSSLPYIYSNLTGFDIVLGGISLDGMFRGHLGNTRKSPLNLFKKDIPANYENDWVNIFNSDLNNFKETINETIFTLKKELGDLTLNENHLRYAIYTASPKLFGGELAISKNFTTIRVPGWDKELRKLVFSIEESCITFSEIGGHKRNSRDEMILQSYLISQLGPKFRKIRTRNTTPSIVLKGEIPFQAYKLYTRFLDKSKKIIFGKNKHVPLEDWDNWINNNCKELINDLIFSDGSYIKEYFTKNYLDKIKLSNDFIVKGKLLTIEIILRLMKSRWKKFW